MKCPKCGYHRQPRDHVFTASAECPACGIVYAKYEADESAPPAMAPSAATRSEKKSPVHESSLRQARERVEMRLRNQKKMLARDDLRNRTLERARLITDAVMRQRQEEWRSDQKPSESEASLAAVGVNASTAESTPVLQAIDPASAICEAPEATQDRDRNQGLGKEAPAGTTDHWHAVEVQKADPPAERFEFEPYYQEVYQEAQESEQERLEHLEDIAAASQEALPGAGRGDFFIARPGTLLARLLPVVACLILCAGLVGAVLSWTTISNVQAGASGGLSTPPTILPVALLLGFAYLVIGILGFAFFWVSSIISTQLKEIERLLHPGWPRPNNPPW